MSKIVNIAKTPIAPYLGLIDGMEREEKIAVAMYLVNSIPGIKLIETKDGNVNDDDYLAEKLEQMTFSPRIERLFEKRKAVAENVDLNDERIRHILGL
jgi:pantoate kinase